MEFAPDEIVWDIGNPGAMPPWGNNISTRISSLANYFVTSRGRDLFDVLFEAIDALGRNAGLLTVESM